MSAETVPVPPEYKETIYELDRLYQRFATSGRHIYWCPIDEGEEERLFIQDEIVRLAFGANLFFRSDKYPQRVLDCGYGQATWASQVAQQYPDCEVIGVDIHPIDLLDYPENLKWECDDLNQSLTDIYETNSFDIIQSRFVAQGIHKNRWPSYIGELASLLKGGGVIQMIEYYTIMQSNNGTLTENHAIYQWGAKYRAAMQTDRNPRIANSLSALLRNAGFDDVQERYIPLPIGFWPENARERQIGERNLDNIDRMLDNFGLMPLVRRGGMSKDAVFELTEQARREARYPGLKLYMPLFAFWGTKR